jgi:hypothetical protein
MVVFCLSSPGDEVAFFISVRENYLQSLGERLFIAFTFADDPDSTKRKLQNPGKGVQDLLNLAENRHIISGKLHRKEKEKMLREDILRQLLGDPCKYTFFAYRIVVMNMLLPE